MAQSSIVSTDTQIEVHVLNEEPFSTDFYLDIGQCLSTINRRSYRQAMNYAVASIEAFSVSGCRVGVSIIPTTWVADNATTKAFETWKDQRAEVLRDQPSLKAKWSDFKIYMDSAHSQLGVISNLTPVDGNGNSYLLGEWDASQFVLPLPGAAQAAAGDAHETVFHVVGDHIPPGLFDPTTILSTGLIKAYAASRARVLSPDPVQVGQYITGFYNVN